MRWGSVGRYCAADERWTQAVRFLDAGDGAGWQLLQVGGVGGGRGRVGWVGYICKLNEFGGGMVRCRIC